MSKITNIKRRSLQSLKLKKKKRKKLKTNGESASHDRDIIKYESQKGVKEHPHGVVAFVATPNFRNPEKKHISQFKDFIYSDLRELCSLFSVYATKGTYDDTIKCVNDVRLNSEEGKKVVKACKARGVIINDNDSLEMEWRKIIKDNFNPLYESYRGVIQVTNEMIWGKIDALIHLLDWDDVVAKADTMALMRQSQVHDVPIAYDVTTAKTMINNWVNRRLDFEQKDITLRQIHPRRQVDPDIDKINNKLKEICNKYSVSVIESKPKQTLALIAHNGKKLEMCRFVVENYKTIFNNYDTIFTTGTTGKWIQDFLLAVGVAREDNVREKVVRCLSGPLGGDVQIAWMVVLGICKKVIFFEDPMESHAHETDIRLFHQATLSGVPIALGFNPATALTVLNAEEVTVPSKSELI